MNGPKDPPIGFFEYWLEEAEKPGPEEDAPLVGDEIFNLDDKRLDEDDY